MGIDPWGSVQFDVRQYSRSTATTFMAGSSKSNSAPVSPITRFLEPYSYQDSSCGSLSCEDDYRSASHETGNPAVVDAQDGMAVQHDPAGEPKFRCWHPDCHHKSFKKEKDLKRHKRNHDPEYPLYQCGCCQNLGQTYKGNKRLDKVRDHVRNIHDTRKSMGLGIECPKDDCNTLLTAASCLDQHMRQEHSNSTLETLSQTTNGATCDCKEEADSRRQMSKNRASSPLESMTKRRNRNTDVSESLPMAPHFTGFHASQVPTDSSAAVASNDWPNELAMWEYDFLPNHPNETQGFLYHPLNDADNLNGAFTNGHHDYDTGPVDMSRRMSTSNLNPYTSLADSSPYVQTSVQLVLNNSKPAEFLAVRETPDFQNMAVKLRTTHNNNPCAPASSITYNPGKETITLTGSRTIIEQLGNTLQSLQDSFSKKWGEKYLVTSHSGLESEASTSRAYALDSRIARYNTNSQRARVFPIRPKDHLPLVKIWFKCILPALPQILRPILGGTYTASLVRQGLDSLNALPCIQIESQCIPGKAAQGIIQDSLRKICQKERHPPTLIRFLQGGVKKLNGSQQGDIDDAGDSADSQRLRFNLFRPCSQLGMGASLGLLCSKKVSATLGGYILIEGDKYMLTSDHFVATSREPANTDGDDADCETLTSPSRYDLNHMENCLKQTKRDLNSEINSLVKNRYGDLELREEGSFSDQVFYSCLPELSEMKARDKYISNLLGQVTEPSCEYKVGAVFMGSLEPRTASIPESLANLIHLHSCTLKYHMDWSLCKSKYPTGENRHRYRSVQDAMKDDYVYERDRTSQPGDVCHETCDAVSGAAIYYVGQGSQHRSGTVNLPMLVSTDSSVTHAWAIMSSEGEEILYSHVAGDSGAWVIRQDDNKLMGQVYAYGNGGQVLFTPINAIFDDIGQLCEQKISLPPGSPDPRQLVMEVRPLCAVQVMPPAQPYKFLSKISLASATYPKDPPAARTFPDIRSPKPSSKQFGPHYINSTLSHECSSPICDSPSSLPSLTYSPKSPEAPQLFGSPVGADIPDGLVKIDNLPDKSLQHMVVKSRECKFPYLVLDEQGGDRTIRLSSYRFQLTAQLLCRAISIARATTWPMDSGSKFAKSTQGSGVSQHQTSQNHDVLTPAGSLLDRFAWPAFENENFNEFESILGPSKRGARTLSMYENTSEQKYSPILERCNIVV